MSWDGNLTEGAIEIMSNKSAAPVHEAFVQILSVKLIGDTPNNANANQQQTKPERYRIVISDGKHFQPTAMLGTSLNPLVQSNEITRFSVVRVKKYACSEVSDRQIIILIDVEPVAQAAAKIGEPVALNSASDSAQAASAKPVASAATGAPSSSSTGNPTTPTKAPNTMGMDALNVSPVRGVIPKVKSSAAQDFDPTASVAVLINNNQPVFTVPINQLNPFSARQIVLARVTSKSPIRTFTTKGNNPRDGKLFSVDLIDSSGEIRMTGFGDAVDRFYNVLEANKAYYIHRMSVKEANRKFAPAGARYELHIESNTEIIPSNEESSLPTVSYNFTNIAKLETAEADTIVDVIGVCRETHDIVNFTAKTTNKQMTKRDIVLGDQTGCSINLTLWGALAESFDGSGNPVVAIKGAKISTFNGKTLSALTSSIVTVNPDTREANHLRGWYDSEGNSMQFRSLSTSPMGAGGVAGGGAPLERSIYNDTRKTFAQVRDENLGVKKADYFVVKALPTFFKKDTNSFFYRACPKDGCGKKLTANQNAYHCDKCNADVEDVKFRLMLSLSAVDHTGQTWLTAFSEGAEQILGQTAQEIGMMAEKGEEGKVAIDGLFKAALGKRFLFKIKAAQQVYQEETKTRLNIMNVAPIDFPLESKLILSEIHKLLN